MTTPTSNGIAITGEDITVIDTPLRGALDAMTLDTAQRILHNGPRLILGDPGHMAAAQFMDELAAAKENLSHSRKKQSFCHLYFTEGKIPAKLKKCLPGVVQEAMKWLAVVAEEETKAKEAAGKEKRGRK